MWHDGDVEQAQFTIGILLRRFLSVESMLDAPEAATASDVRSLVRIAVSPPQARERSLIVELPADDEPWFGAVHARMQEITAHLSASVPRDSILAALGLLMHELMSEIDHVRRGSEDQVTS
jgi:hypothetical protein